MQFMIEGMQVYYQPFMVSKIAPLWLSVYVTVLLIDIANNAGYFSIYGGKVATHFSSSVIYFAKVSFGFFLLLQYEVLGINLFSQDSLYRYKAMENYAFFVVTRRLSIEI